MSRTPWGGILLIVLGVALLLATLGLVAFGTILRFWPMLLILAGLKLVFERSEGGPPAPPT